MLLTYDPKDPARDLSLPSRQTPLYLGEWNIKPTPMGVAGVKSISVDYFKKEVLDVPGRRQYVQDLVALGKLAMIAPGGKRTGGDVTKWPSHANASASFGDFPPAEAVSLVKSCVDVEQLEKWKTIQGLDANVAKEIGLQLDALNPDIPNDF